MVAKSYQELPIIGEPYIKNNRMYVLVKTKSNREKEVRWYSDQEYAKMYPQDKETAAAGGPTVWKNQKEVLGFDKGYIWILKDPTEENEEYLRAAGYPNSTRWWDTYVKSTVDFPELPFHIKLVKLYWDDVCEEDGCVRDGLKVEQAVAAARFGDLPSKWMGEVGDRLELDLTVIKVSKKDTQWGTQTDHIFEDKEGNWYQWITTAKSLELNHSYHAKGSVKAQGIHLGKKITILTRCRIS